MVLSSASDKPALNRDTILDLAAGCVRPFYDSQIEDFKAQLAAHAATTPPPVVFEPSKKYPVSDAEFQKTMDGLARWSQVSTKNSQAINAVTKKFGAMDFEEQNALSKALSDNNAAIDPTWFAIRFRLQALMDERKLAKDKRTDKRVLQSKMRVAQRAFDLTDFSDATAKSIEAKCLVRTPVKEIVTSTSYGTALARWPVEMPISFWTGAALLVLGLLLGPISTWLRAA